MESKVTIYDIAKITGSNITAVSRAFQKNGRIRSDKRLAILEAAEKYGYKPNKNAVSLPRKSIKIGMVIIRLIPEYSDVLVDGVKKAHAVLADFKVECDIRVLEADQDKEINYINILDEFKNDKYNGVIICVLEYGADLINKINELSDSGIPVVTLTSDTRESKRLFASVNNTEAAGRMAAEILSVFMKGNRAAVFSGDLDSLNHSSLVASFKNEAIKRDLDIVEVYDTSDSPQKAYEEIKQALFIHPDINGIYISSANSLPVIKYIIDKGRSGDIKLVTSDVFPGLVQYIKDGTVSATIFQDPLGQAKTAFDNLYYHIAENRQYSGQLMVTPQIVMQSNLDLYI